VPGHLAPDTAGPFDDGEGRHEVGVFGEAALARVEYLFEFSDDGDRPGSEFRSVKKLHTQWINHRNLFLFVSAG
jgi:hypothetical protein